jgi:hypothetical protein
MARRSSIGAVALGDLVERQGEVEDLARVDLAVSDEVDRKRCLNVALRQNDTLAFSFGPN